MRDDIVIYRSEGITFNNENIRCRINGQEMSGFYNFYYSTNQDRPLQVEENVQTRNPTLQLSFKFGANEKPLCDYLKNESYHRIEIEREGRYSTPPSSSASIYLEGIIINLSNVNFSFEYEKTQQKRDISSI
jgi:hypothetical protein